MDKFEIHSKSYIWVLLL